MRHRQSAPSALGARLVLITATTLLAATLAVAGGLPGPVSHRILRPPAAASVPAASRAVFERRILPLLRANNPSTCSECHLSGVDLKDYIRPSEAQTFAALRGRGMLDVKHPDESRLLKFIRMSRPKTPLVTQKVRAAEYAAFRDWIVAAVKDPRLARASAPTVGSVGPAVPDTVIRHTRIDSVVASFTRNIWSQQGRCMNCHQAGTPDNDANVKKFGARVAWFKPDSPEATMRALIAQGDVDVEQPARSLLLLKPLGKVPHGGGVKMLLGDAGYKMFRAWTEDYAACVKGKYRTAGDLPTPPEDALVDLKCVLAVSGGPLAWKDRSLRVDVYPWDSAAGAWAERPAVTGERPVGVSGGGSGTNLILYMVVPARDALGGQDRLLSRLGQGRYLLKYYCDTAGRLDKDYTIPTDSPAFYQGQQEVSAVWNKGAGWGAPVQVRIDLNAPLSPSASRGGARPGG